VSAAEAANAAGPAATVEDDDAFAARVAGTGVARVRLLGGASASALATCFDAGADIDPTPVVGHGRIELLCWVHEQVLSETRHRLGTLLDP